MCLSHCSCRSTSTTSPLGIGSRQQPPATVGQRARSPNLEPSRFVHSCPVVHGGRMSFRRRCFPRSAARRLRNRSPIAISWGSREGTVVGSRPSIARSPTSIATTWSVCYRAGSSSRIKPRTSIPTASDHVGGEFPNRDIKDVQTEPSRGISTGSNPRSAFHAGCRLTAVDVS
jgi:hypothetical protein